MQRGQPSVLSVLRVLVVFLSSVIEPLIMLKRRLRGIRWGFPRDRLGRDSVDVNGISVARCVQPGLEPIVPDRRVGSGVYAVGDGAG